MKKILMSFVLIICAASLAAAQQNSKAAAIKRPNLGGVWIPQGEKEKKPEAGAAGWSKVNIEQHETEVKFTLVYPSGSTPPKREFIFYTDERGETNRGAPYFYFIANDKKPDEEVKSTTKWDGNVLVNIHQLVIHIDYITVNVEVTIRWEISDDGKTLNRTMKILTKSATYQKTADSEKHQLPVNEPATEMKDTFLLLETKR